MFIFYFWWAQYNLDKCKFNRNDRFLNEMNGIVNSIQFFFLMCQPFAPLVFKIQCIGFSILAKTVND